MNEQQTEPAVRVGVVGVEISHGAWATLLAAAAAAVAAIAMRW